MKILISILLMFTIASCNQDTSNNKLKQSKYVELYISDNIEIYGRWIMCSTLSNGTMIQKNTCPSIIFETNGTGYIQNNSIITENFIWTMNKVSMKIIYHNQDSNSTFSDTNYYAAFYKQNAGLEFVLRHNDNFYYLSK